ncbi:MAG: hypothetical protein GX601_06450 [Anaerolineales bacterium]|nr:hypothetical protein [Anaerolineales bacterium]
MVKLLMSWNIRQGRESEYFEFIVQEFGPALVKLGVRPTDAWYTAYGDRPQILTGGVAEDLETLRKVLASQEWRNLKKSLLGYITDYNQKIIRASGGFQL